MPSYAVIGASRGIGLEYVRQLASRSDMVVFAVVRNPEGSTHLNAVAASFKNIHIILEDVVDYNSLESLANDMRCDTGSSEASFRDHRRKLDYLIHNAASTNVSTVYKGFDDYANMDELDAEFISAAYKINSLGPIHAITAFLPLLRASDTKKIVVIGSGAADPKSTQVRRLVAYSMTKAAALIAATKFAVKLQDEGFVVVTICPGMVDCSATAGADTEGCRKCEVVAASLKEMSSSMKSQTGIEVTPQTPEASVAAQLKVIDGLEASHNGLFLQHTGGEYRPRN
ncbi:hypothetical protein GSI_07488 [Ganoderma sinense ZZ0214-1]|uniref:Uncharacterized protein n=1 Tax=Ganoderma sinense ZZ0214-1 TaxID=1077348 RepID=A0A2G8S973_9APHY|nr:hypothetical protein GSI_07488 [Ganoderma sinense ZZ0214-1]